MIEININKQQTFHQLNGTIDYCKTKGKYKIYTITIKRKNRVN